MSVRTTADERLESARQHIVMAIRDLSAVLVGECWGHDEYEQDYKNGLREVMVTLMEINHNNKV